MKRHIAILSVASLAALPLAHHAPEVSNAFLPQAKAQGPAGCYDPARVSGQQLRLLQSWGTPPCEKSKAGQSASQGSDPGPSWAVDINGAHAHALEDRALILMVGCSETDDDIASAQLGAIQSRDKNGLRQALMGGEPKGGLAFTVEAASKAGLHRFSADTGSPIYGGSLIDEKGTDHAGGQVQPADLRALMRATAISVRVAGRSFTFPVRKSGEMIGKLPCSP